MNRFYTSLNRMMVPAFGMLLFFNVSSFSQSSIEILSDINENEIVATGERYTFPKNYRTLRLNKQAAQQFFSTAPAEDEFTRRNSTAIFSLPMPDGSSSRFRIWETDIMHPGLAAQFPDIKTYAGQGIDDVHASIRLDMTPLGFHAMVLSPNGSVWIDPYCENTTDDYICYFKRDLIRTTSFECETGLERTNIDDYRELIPQQLYTEKSAGTQLRTYRLAVACTGEYAATKGGTVSGAMAGIVTSINRVDGVYETEVAVSLNLIANNSDIVYTNSSTDPYTNGNGSTMLGQNQTTCTNVIGSANYDIGHVFSTGGGGVAGLGVVCSSTNKARGVTGSSNPVGDAFDIDYVAHEMGHQFAGNHTFNGTGGSCSGNRAASAAYETGSGITIMAYAGICGTDNLAPNSIAYFHTYSFDEIVNFTTTGGGNSCAVVTGTGNNPPNVSSQGSNYTIPISTPFVLTGAATDPDGDPLTYSWEEMDLGTAGALNVQSTTAPQFCPFSPVTSPTRIFPKLSSIINNSASVGEWLPNQARTLKFRLTARDNRVGGGGVMHPDVNVTLAVANTGGAFAVTAPNTAVTWAGGSTQTVSWDVNGTNGSPINCANVKISLSTDGGNTFPTVILASTANDGTESILVPNVSTTQARIMVEAVGNIFFDMGNANFTITGGAPLTAISTSAISPGSYCAGASVSVGYTATGTANAGNIFTAQLSNSSGSFVSPVAIGTLSSTSSGTIAGTIPAGTSTGSGYRIRVVSSNPVITGTDNGSNITISGQVSAAGSINTAFTTFCANIPITFNMNPIANATNYTWAATGGAAISSGQGTTQVVIVFPNTISSSTISVFGSNANCTGSSSSLGVTIMATPNTPVANNATGCSGTPVTLTGSPSGGTFSVTNPYTGPSTTFTYNVANPNGCNTTSNPASISITTSPTVSISGTSTICTGSSTTLTASGASTYQWTGGPATAAYQVSPLTSTTYTVTGISAGCTGIATRLVTVNPLPSVTANDVDGCTGSSIPLSGTPAGGTWSVSNPYSGSTTTYTHSFTDANGCSNTSAPANITVHPLPSVSFSGLAASYDVSSPAATLTGSPAGGIFSGPGISGNTFTPASAGAGGPYTISYAYTDVNNCSNTSSQQTTVTNCTVPLQPGTIAVTGGNAKVCPGDTRTYTVGAVSGATFYNWSTPVGANIISGSGTRSVSITYNINFIATGTLSVTAGNGCGNSPVRTLTITRNNPSTPSVISGAATAVCAGTSGNYSITNVTGLTYNWVPPANATITAGQGTNSVSVSFSALFTSGSLSVTGSNACGTSNSRTLAISSKPSTPGTINGASSLVCAGTTGNYSVTNVNGVTYNWVAPPNASITSGQGTNSVTVSFSLSFTSGTMSVTAGNVCGQSSARTLLIKSVPSQPGTMTGSTYGNCNATQTYSISPVSGATSYTWSTNIAGAVITPSGTSASVIFPQFTSGTISVAANNSCGSSVLRSLTVRGTPATPASIAGSATACANQQGVPYSITPIITATSYTWTAPTGSTIFDGTTTSSGSSMVTTSTSVNINFGSTAGNVSARASNNCGLGTARNLAITFNCRDAGLVNGPFSFSVFPNPASEDAEIVFLSESNSKYSILLTDLVGKTVELIQGNTVMGENRNFLDLRNISRGVYLLHVIKGEEEKISRLVVN